jgi:hypothetical protein
MDLARREKSADNLENWFPDETTPLDALQTTSETMDQHGNGSVAQLTISSSKQSNVDKKEKTG